MAIKLDIQVGNGGITITIGGTRSDGHGTGGAASTGKGGSTPIDGDGPGGGQPDGGGRKCCSGTTVIGPIIIDAHAMQGKNGRGGSTPIDGDGPGGSTPIDGDGPGGSTPIDGDGPGGGGPGSGECCGTTVIGPIVIGGCAGQSASSSGSSPSLPAPKAIALDPPPQMTAMLATDGPPPVFTMQPQQESEWCWAAVAVSINDFLDARNPSTWTQASLATKVVENELNLRPGSLDCSQSPLQKKCNRPEPLGSVLAVTGNLSSLGARFNQYLVFDSIKKWVDRQLPIAARIVWNGGGAHFVALDGYRESTAGVQMVHVQDPLFESGFLLYDDLVQDYQQLLTGGGKWQDTYPVQA